MEDHRNKSKHLDYFLNLQFDPRTAANKSTGHGKYVVNLCSLYWASEKSHKIQPQNKTHFS